MTLSDTELLRGFIVHRDENAFRQLVERHLDLVHAVARRVTASDDLARDVAQNTFIRLAREANRIPRHVTLAAWLHRTCRSLAIDLVRSEESRRKRETKALENRLMESPPEPEWSLLSPVIDELVDRLSPAEREIIMLRFYRDSDYRKAAQAMGVTEEAARKRGARALERLRDLLAKRGILTTTAALSTLLPAHAAPAAPALLSASIVQAAHGVTPLAGHFITTLLLTVTTSQKFALAGSLLLLAAATGYSLSPDPSVAALAATRQQAVIIPTSDGEISNSRPDRLRTARIVPATQQERLDRLRAIMEISNNNQRNEEFIAYLNVLSPGLFEETAKYLKEIRYGESDEFILLTASAWAKADLPAALDYVTHEPDRGLAVGFADDLLREWATTDPKAALAWTLTHFPDYSPLVDSVLVGTAKTRPGDIGKLVRSLPVGEARWVAFSNLAPVLAKDPVMLKAVLAGASESQRGVILSNVAEQPEGIGQEFETVRERPEAMPSAGASYFFTKWASRDKAAAISALDQLPYGPRRKEGLGGLLYVVPATAPSEALALMDRFPDAVTDEQIDEFFTKFSGIDPALMLGELHRISDEEKRTAVLVSQLGSWLEKDPVAARQWLAAHPQPESVTGALPGNN